MMKSKDVVKHVNEKLVEFEDNLTNAQDLINRLKQAGESTIELETQFNQARSKLERLKNAFKES